MAQTIEAVYNSIYYRVIIDAAAVCGLIFAFIAYRRSVTTEAAAMAAANEMRSMLVRHGGISDCTAVIKLLDEIRRHVRAANWAVVPDRYSEARRTLIVLRATNRSLTKDHQRKIQAVITHCLTTEELIDSCLGNPLLPMPEVAGLNRIIGHHADDLQRILSFLTTAEESTS